MIKKTAPSLTYQQYIYKLYYISAAIQRLPPGLGFHGNEDTCPNKIYIHFT